MHKTAVVILLCLTCAAHALEPGDQVRINEIYFAGAVSGELQDGFIELYNAGDAVAYLDGALLAQGPDTLSQLGFSFPGVHGETSLPLLPGEFLVVAIDAHDFSASDPSTLDLSASNYETAVLFEAEPGDNLGVANLEISVDVGFDWFFERAWGMVTLSTGENWFLRPCQPGQACGTIVAEIPVQDIVDGVEYLYQLGDTLPILRDDVDAGVVLGIPDFSGMSAERVTPGQDTNNSFADFVTLSHPTPGFSTSLAAGERVPRVLPAESRIQSVYPNPFNSGTTIRIELASPASPALEIFDLLGRRIARVHHGPLSAGVHTLRWNGTNVRGLAAPSGLYFVRLSDSGMSSVARVVLAR